MTEPRFPQVAAAKGHYESFYLRAVDPARPRGAWIRYTTHQRPGEWATGSVWCTWFDADAAEPYAVKQTSTAPTVPAGGWVEVGESTFGPSRAQGRAEGHGRTASWDLAVEGTAEPLRHLPRAWMYRAPLPRTKAESPLPAATFTGSLQLGGEPPVPVEGWPGMVGHNWGSEHAATWIWLNGVAFAGSPGAWLDLTVGRVRVGPVLSPWIANGALCVDGRRIRLGGLRAAKVTASPAGCQVELPGVVVEARARADQTVAWPYADPAGGEHHALNCSIASVDVHLDRDGRRAHLSTDHGGVYELGTSPGGHSVPLQPFTDG